MRADVNLRNQLGRGWGLELRLEMRLGSGAGAEAGAEAGVRSWS